MVIGGAIVVTLLLLCSGTMAYFFYKYTWENPDEDACYVDTTTGEVSIEPITGADNIADIWHRWFLINFFSTIAVALYSTLMAIQLCCECACFIDFSGDSEYGEAMLGISGLIWIVLVMGSLLYPAIEGSTQRFNSEGRACSKDLLESSGRFMLTWLII